MLRFIACLLLACGLASTPAGASSDGHPVDYFTLSEAAGISKRIERELASRGVYAALVFRAGQPREDLPEGLEYTHGSFWVYGPIDTVGGGTTYGYAVYSLYHGFFDETRSHLAQDWPLDFVRGAAADEFGIIIPTPQMQVRILDVIASDTYEALHQPAYSALSNPGDPRFQNAEEFLLDVVASAAWLRTDRAQIKSNLRAYFAPAIVKMNWFERLMADWFDPRIDLDDQPGPVRIATFSTIADFMLAFDLASDVVEIEAASMTD